MTYRRMVCAGVVVVAALAVAAWAVAQPGGFGGGFGGPPPGGGRPGGGPGDMGAMVYLEKSWTAVCFQLDCTIEQQEGLKPTYATELSTRNEAVAKAMKKRDMEAMQKALSTCKANLTAKLKEVLTEEQRDKLDKVMQSSAPAPPN